jgi:hypothetical protein
VRGSPASRCLGDSGARMHTHGGATCRASHGEPPMRWRSDGLAVVQLGNTLCPSSIRQTSGRTVLLGRRRGYLRAELENGEEEVARHAREFMAELESGNGGDTKNPTSPGFGWPNRWVHEGAGVVAMLCARWHGLRCGGCSVACRRSCRRR